MKDSENKSLREIIHELKDDIREMAIDIIFIKGAIRGDNMGNNGLIKKVHDQDKRLGRLEKFNIRLASFFAGVFTLINIFITLLIKYL